MCTCGSGWFSSFISVCSPKGNSTATITAGIAKNTASDLLPPTDCFGGESSRLRYRTMHQIRSASTPMKTGSASAMITRYSWWTSLPVGEIPCFAQPAKSSVAGTPVIHRRARVRLTGASPHRGQVTVKAWTMPLAACGGPLSPPDWVPVCQQANA